MSKHTGDPSRELHHREIVWTIDYLDEDGCRKRLSLDDCREELDTMRQAASVETLPIAGRIVFQARMQARNLCRLLERRGVETFIQRNVLALIPSDE